MIGAATGDAWICDCAGTNANSIGNGFGETPLFI